MRVPGKIIFLLIFCISCHKNDQNHINVADLTNDSVKYWTDIWKKPFFSNYKEGGLAFYKNGQLIEYRRTDDNIRVALKESSDDVFCNPTMFKTKSDTLFINRCGWTFIFRIKKLSKDSLLVEELSDYGYFPNFGTPKDSIEILYTISHDQKTRLSEDYRDFTQGPIIAIPKK